MKNLSNCKIKGRKICDYLLTVGLALFITTASAQQSANKEIDIAEWTDPSTKIIWAHCSAGQQWDGQTCIGKPIKMSLKEAKAYSQAQRDSTEENWRLPRVDELVTIRQCFDGWLRSEYNYKAILGPVLLSYIPNERGTLKYVPLVCKPVNNIIANINRQEFPNTATDEGYWTSSASSYTDGYAWAVHFGGGYGYNTNPEARVYVRLVKDN